MISSYEFMYFCVDDEREHPERCINFLRLIIKINIILSCFSFSPQEEKPGRRLAHFGSQELLGGPPAFRRNASKGFKGK